MPDPMLPSPINPTLMAPSPLAIQQTLDADSIAAVRGGWHATQALDCGQEPHIEITSGWLKITGPNLFGPYFSVSSLIIKQFGRLSRPTIQSRWISSILLLRL